MPSPPPPLPHRLLGLPGGYDLAPTRLRAGGSAMIILPPDHTVIREAITKHLASKKRDVIDVSWITDFDGTVYKLQSGSPEEPENRALLCMSIQLAGYDEIADAHPDFLQKTCYAPYLRETEAGDGSRTFCATLMVDLDTLAEEGRGAKPSRGMS